MNTSATLLFFFSALGAFNGLLLSGYLLLAKRRNIANIFLSMLLLMVSIRISKSVFFFFNPQLANEFLHLGLSACLLIGPFLYFYSASAMNKLDSMWLSWKIQLVSFIGIIGYTFWQVPYAKDSETWSLFFYLINRIWLVYILLAAYCARDVLIKLWQEKRLNDANDITLISVLVGVSLIWLAYFTSHYTSYIAGALSFSVVLYLNLLFFALRKRVVKEPEAEKYSDKKIAPEQANQDIAALKQLFTQQQLHRDASITLNRVAKRLGKSAPYLSQLINDNMQLTFVNFINQYRIDDAKQLLKTQDMKIDDIALQCGFNSTSTFYAVFKKHTQLTPAAFRKNSANNDV
ncbi:helix-turn-helix transcriptional regulator [Psychrobium sp. MM17-31]|uniref:helix-turn-helix domain-containing protein n=1 Tax=Psychrobium sp. MM17-31 TaxID=2917758 RepID=UPI001EF4BA26|nr:AraC family transcriptional regulator [Psychrobium sp. MM17-31]MCG7532417.1 helix-turn-helix transcriptional regulator [Psychrobium sp. MM17-31]